LAKKWLTFTRAEAILYITVRAICGGHSR